MAGTIEPTPENIAKVYGQQVKPMSVTISEGRISDADVERIARRVAELIQGRNYQGTVIPRSADAP